MKKNKFNPGIKITIFFVFFAVLFFSLGLWQIDRGQAKTVLLDEFEKNSLKSPGYISKDSKKWDRVYVEGSWDGSNQLLIDNVIRKGIAGYKVLTPFKLINTNEIILIDRGWIPRNRNIEVLPNIDLINSNERVSGILESPELGLTLSDELVTDVWPKVSQTKNLEVISKEYSDQIYPFILLADPTSRNSLEYIKINPTNMTPIKHYGYSAQWFLMFIVLCVMYIWYGFKRNEK
jgi:cytochrome oxidase assembly protein ShyY1